MTELIAAAQGTIQGLFGPQYGPSAWVLAKSLAGIVMVLVPLLLTVLYYQLVERWVIGWIQVRKGPNRVGWFGLLQPIADAVKLLMKERIVPTGASQGLFFLAPILAVAPALAVWAVVPFAPGWVVANVDAAPRRDGPDARHLRRPSRQPWAREPWTGVFATGTRTTISSQASTSPY